MERLLIVAIALLLLQGIATESQVCPLNEVYNECGTSCPLTCDNYKSPPDFCTDDCVVGCECEEGYVRNTADGSCCLDRECPETSEPTAEPIVCPLHEVYNECGSSCAPTCDNYKSPPDFCTLECVVGCECEEGYVRNTADGSCCLESECPEPEQICPLHEVYNECGSACAPTCDNYDNPQRVCTMQCIVGCECEEGYVRNTADGSCCLISECPARACPLNQEYKACGSACPLTCENYKNPPRFCTENCVAGCHCKADYVKKADGSCCLKAECKRRGLFRFF